MGRWADTVGFFLVISGLFLPGKGREDPTAALCRRSICQPSAINSFCFVIFNLLATADFFFFETVIRYSNSSVRDIP